MVLAHSFCTVYSVYSSSFTQSLDAHTHRTVKIFAGDAVFGCPQTCKYYPEEDFSCQEKIYTALLTQVSSQTHKSSLHTSNIVMNYYPFTYVYLQALQSPPGSKYNYSDLSMITLMYVVGTLARSVGYTACMSITCIGSGFMGWGSFYSF